MDLQRVKEILSAQDEVSVHYHGVPIWIESIDSTSSMAVISSRGTQEERQLVSIDSLAE
ncbi:H-type small acid-soluble spore protein [Mesobacillus jeotgali]|uniref:H-type small acid-soluble spore protein n=1 Tax=Mesobacillus jeotgali TaxID=129985 RepID=A0ABY9VPB6_9BACI|nr:H-type small acid-soluble spore protein [Mesobacillus jeotgali]WNF24989.1 H-type small acid-soluble spore protein [Mesobacillus jeotgali]